MHDLRPSASSHWFKCAAYPRFIAALPDEPASDPAREGTCAAWLAEMVLTGEVSTTSELIGHSHENGWLIDNEMASYIQGYVDHLRTHGGTIRAERKVRLNEMIAGTPDANVTTIPRGDGSLELIVDDLKYGFDPVDPYRNPQLGIYSGAIAKELTRVGFKIRKVTLGIYQPRSNHPDGIYRKWVITHAQLMSFVSEIEAAGHDAQEVNAPATPGYHCLHCRAATGCVALTQSIYRSYRTVSDERYMQLTPEQLASDLKFTALFEKMLAARMTALKAEAVARMENAEHIPGFGFQERYGNNKLSKGPMAILASVGVDPFETKKLCTPAELIRRGRAAGVKDIEKIVKGMSTRPRIPPKLVELDDDHYKRMFDKKDNLE